MEVDLETVKTLAVQGTAVNMVAAATRANLGASLFVIFTPLPQRLTAFYPQLCILFTVAGHNLDALQLNNSRHLGITTLGFMYLPSFSLHVGLFILRADSQLVLCIAFFFYAGERNVSIPVDLINYSTATGGVTTLCGLTIQDYVGEDVIINNSLSSLPGCYAKSIPAIIAGYWIAPVCVESVLFALVFSKIFYWWKTGISPPPLIAVLVRDSMIYFSVIFGSSGTLLSRNVMTGAYSLRSAFLISNLFMFYFGPPFIAGSLLVTPSAAAGCVMGSHMLLNLRQASSQSWMPARIV
ncbi:hypothetical protein BDZ94DRAFT_1312309 [Collybia nuda]|uniref:Uncharacterized protein n=1 Tax=Collybia nuda TaxID=64659 RepID=A0A9P5Y1A5_9AGAR|nr:hypothetical protein BDZ94DRAFT_1312309 [Collybia nuda]